MSRDQLAVALNLGIFAQGGPEMCLSLEHQNPSKTSEKMGYLACESIRFSFALRRWGRFARRNEMRNAKRPQRRRAKEKQMLSQAMGYFDRVTVSLHII